MKGRRKRDVTVDPPCMAMSPFHSAVDRLPSKWTTTSGVLTCHRMLTCIIIYIYVYNYIYICLVWYVLDSFHMIINETKKQHIFSSSCFCCCSRAHKIPSWVSLGKSCFPFFSRMYVLWEDALRHKLWITIALPLIPMNNNCFTINSNE